MFVVMGGIFWVHHDTRSEVLIHELQNSLAFVFEFERLNYLVKMRE